MDPFKFTLRDLWHLFDEEEKRRWQQAQIKKMFPQQSFMDGLATYPAAIMERQSKIPPTAKGLEQIYSIPEYQREMMWACDRFKHPKQPKGYL